MTETGGGGDLAASGGSLKKLELRMFLFLTVVLAPALSVALVGGLGLAIWLYQAFAGPPGPPA